MSQRTEVLVVGAGVVGLSVARSLAARGAQVTVLDARHPGGDGSRAAAGVAIPSVRLLDDPVMVALTAAAREVLAADLASLPEAATLRRGGGILRTAPDARTRADLEARAQKFPGWLGCWLDAPAVVEREPALQGTPITGAFLQDDGYMVDTEAYVTALLHDAQARGVALRLSEALALVEQDGPAVRVRTERGTLHCDRLVIAAGAWSGGLGGLPVLPVKPMRGQMLTVMQPGARLSHIVSGPTYFAPWRGGELVVGATEEDAGFAAHNTPTGLLHLLAALARTAPLLREARFVRAWAGLRSSTPNGHPLLGPYPGAPRTFLATGHGGQGILTGALTGRAVADLLDAGKSEWCERFDPARVLGVG